MPTSSSRAMMGLARVYEARKRGNKAANTIFGVYECISATRVRMKRWDAPLMIGERLVGYTTEIMSLEQE